MTLLVKGLGLKVPAKRLADDAPSMFDDKNIDSDPTELATDLDSFQRTAMGYYGNPFPLWPPKESLKSGETQALHFTVSRYTP